MPYARAPISEAVLEIKTLDLNCGLAALRDLGDSTPEYPEVREINKNEVQFQFGGDVPVPVAQGKRTLHGFQFWSREKTRVWQAWENGFSMSMLHPYASWEAMSEEAKRLWGIFRSATGASPARVAVRYINRFDIPTSGRVNFADYFKTVPNIPPELDTGLAGFFMQLILPQADLDAVAVVSQTPTLPNLPNTASIILDIDLYREVNIPQGDKEIWELFDKLRDRKNFIFEQSLLEPARELIR